MSNTVIGPDARCEMSDALLDALTVVDRFGTQATRLEREGVTRAEVDELAKANVLTAGVDDRWTGAQVREIHERLAAASGALWFVMAQHRSPAVAAALTENRVLRERYASRLASGELLGAVSFAHLRRARPTVVAQRHGDAWRVDGRLDWITSWGLADILLLMAETDDGQVVQFLLPTKPREGLVVTGALSLAAMEGTSTVGAVIEGMRVTDDEVAAVLPKAKWLAEDAKRTANVPSAVVGLARAALSELAAEGEARAWPEAIDVAEAWRRDFVEQRAQAYALIDEVDPSQSINERLRLRASLTRLANESASLLITVQAGRAMLTSSNAQRWAREAMFALVQGQTPASRNALIDAYRRLATGATGA
ncbi:MAG TPA: acyl-CoA dehydrogenase family protein [Actinomycetes bacterium]|nr:acyl-CoA dehydrogenase family protein [Actinomycetes bacterium]